MSDNMPKVIWARMPTLPLDHQYCIGSSWTAKQITDHTHRYILDDPVRRGKLADALEKAAQDHAGYVWAHHGIGNELLKAAGLVIAFLREGTET